MDRFLPMLLWGLVMASCMGPAEASCPYSFDTSGIVNGLTADATPVANDFNYIITCPNFIGSVGIAAPTPTEMLDINGAISGGFGAATTAGALDWNDVTNARSGNGHTLLLGNATNGPGPADYFHPFGFEYESHDGTGNLTQFAIPYGYGPSISDGLYMRGRYGGAWTGWVHLISANTAGNVGIGTVNPSYTLDVNGSAAIRSTAYMYNSILYAYESSTNKYLGFNTAGGVGRIGMTDTSNLELQAMGGRVGVGTVSPSYTFYVNGSAGGTQAWQSPSDVRLKKDIVPIEGALAIVEQLQGVRFNWRSPDERSVGKDLKLPLDKPQVGFIAQNLQKVLPEAVTVPADKAAPMSVQESNIIPVLVEAVKEQAAQITQLRNEIASLKRQQSAESEHL